MSFLSSFDNFILLESTSCHLLLLSWTRANWRLQLVRTKWTQELNRTPTRALIGEQIFNISSQKFSSLRMFHHRHKYVFYEINIYAINLVPGQHGVLGAAGLFGEDQVGILLLRCCVACSPWQAGHLSTYSIIIILIIKTRFLFNHIYAYNCNWILIFSFH